MTLPSDSDTAAWRERIARNEERAEAALSGPRCPDCGGLHTSRGTGPCVHCGKPAEACHAFMCRSCSDVESRLALSDLSDEEYAEIVAGVDAELAARRASR